MILASFGLQMSDLAYLDDEALSMMGSGLLGGSSTVPLTPAEVAKYTDGVYYKAKVGVVRIPNLILAFQ